MSAEKHASMNDPGSSSCEVCTHAGEWQVSLGGEIDLSAVPELDAVLRLAQAEYDSAKTEIDELQNKVEELEGTIGELRKLKDPRPQGAGFVQERRMSGKQVGVEDFNHTGAGA